MTRQRVLQAVKQERYALGAAIAVRRDAVTILRLYAESPLEGAERLNSHSITSVSAMKDLRTCGKGVGHNWGTT